MRISDWSSDVCSSDLTEEGRAVVAATGDVDALAQCTKGRCGTAAGCVTGQGGGDRVAEDASCRDGVRIEYGPIDADILLLVGADFGDDALDQHLCALDVELGDDIEIGRASCRERVCQYV